MGERGGRGVRGRAVEFERRAKAVSEPDARHRGADRGGRMLIKIHFFFRLRLLVWLSCRLSKRSHITLLTTKLRCGRSATAVFAASTEAMLTLVASAPRTVSSASAKSLKSFCVVPKI